MVLSYYTLCVFFFKQKTAYEMRISDWSSDVCSSDLVQRPRLRDDRHVRHHRVRTEQDQEIALLEVGKGPVHRASEQKLLRQILRAGVDMERIENLRGSKRPPERACIAVMERRKGRGIAGIDAKSADRKSTRLNSSH